METKHCPDCKEEKPVERFDKHNWWYCRDCINRRAREWRHRKRAKYLESHPPVVRTHKICKTCGELKPLEAFNFGNKKRNWRCTYCKPCQSIRAAADKARRGRKDEDLFYRTKQFGTTPEWFYQTLTEQNHVCGICGHPETDRYKKSGKLKSLAIDHDHNTGKVRGLLCTKCNQSLFLLEKHNGWAEKAVAYLAKHKGETCT